MPMRRLLPLIAALLLAACAGAPPRPELAVDNALAPAQGTRLDERVQAELAAHPGASGFRLVFDGVEAFALRAASARAAGRSLDLQYYIWHNDTTGRLLVRELLQAADRGVRVRLLLDDMDARANNFALAGIDAHPNIEVRVYNPYGSREGSVGKFVETAAGAKRLNRRMHNKAWIADNRVALTGGRNIGDEYFAASEATNFFDLDYFALGPAVEALSRSFDAYWNSPAAYPIAALSKSPADEAALASLRAKDEEALARDRDSAFVRALPTSEPVQRVLAGKLPMQWSARWQVLADDPMKSLAGGSGPVRSQVLDGLREAMAQASREITLISPYFVPGEQGTAALVAQQASGKRVSILTNSLAANDVAAVHGGYSRYRKPLLEGGVEVYELKPTAGAAGSEKKSWFGSSGASLHTKAALFDRHRVFVGSFNLDPRSVSLNCEQGVLVDDEVLAKELQARYEGATGGKFSWKLGRDAKGGLTWTDASGTLDAEPQASFGRKLQSWMTRVLPLEKQL
jgi:putative cardiolipin synthase